jgi:hypothetical protein
LSVYKWETSIEALTIWQRTSTKVNLASGKGELGEGEKRTPSGQHLHRLPEQCTPSQRLRFSGIQTTGHQHASQLGKAGMYLKERGLKDNLKTKHEVRRNFGASFFQNVTCQRKKKVQFPKIHSVFFG